MKPLLKIKENIASRQLYYYLTNKYNITGIYYSWFTLLIKRGICNEIWPSQEKNSKVSKPKSI